MSIIESNLDEKRSFSPSKHSKNSYNLTKEDLIKLNKQFQIDSNKTWADLANTHILWDKNFTNVVSGEAPFYKWFCDGKLNVSKNCIDRHINKKNSAIIHIAENGERRILSYSELYAYVNKFSYALSQLGLCCGDRVIIYMPTIPESIVAMLSCARLGLIHSVVFAGFSSNALRERIIDCKAKIIITVDAFKRSGKIINSKDIVDNAIKVDCDFVENVIVYENHASLSYKKLRDLVWNDILPTCEVNIEPISMSSDSLLFILYTSGSTGKPKGIMHASGGYLLNCIITNKWVFDLKDQDIFWCTADIGWITGHSYVVYGPLACGATILIYDGAPLFPHSNRFWEIIQDNKVSIFYTAPTAIRTLMKVGEDEPKNYNLKSLRILGTVGEPINPKAWMWYYETIGNSQCPIVDTWWQTETGANMIAPIPGINSLIPGTCTSALPGIDAAIVNVNGIQLTQPNQGGDLVIQKPWPSMLTGIWGNDERYVQTYWSKYSSKYYVTGDTARYDENGNIWIMGRSDDVVNVSGHRLGTMEIESALVSHELVAEAAVVSYKHEIKGEAIHAFISLKNNPKNKNELADILREWVSIKIGSIAKPERVSFSDSLPKTRSGKIMRRLLRNLARNERVTGDTSTLENESIIDQLKEIV
tara:strand:- start:13009 stop:14946 length:1938 start_codon:yes stop_codon:yes gene_type:complete